MIGKPKVENRDAQRYVGIRTEVPMRQLPEVIPQLLGEVFAWLGKQGIAPAGAPFIRYHVINMESKMDIEMGVPVTSALSGDGRISAGVLPAGRYAALVYTGVRNGTKANKALLDWAAEKGIVWDRWEAKNGDGFGARLESYLTDPEEEPEQAKWETEVAIKVADDQTR
jgi:effector-binding domain-containing protein